SDMMADSISAPTRKEQPTACIIEYQVVVDPNGIDGLPALNGQHQAGASAIVDHVGKDINVADRPEPGVGVDALPRDAVHQVVMHFASLARLLDVNSFFVAIMYMIVGDFEIYRAANADCFMRRFAISRHIGRSQI